MPDYFTLAELRALPDMSDTVKYSPDRVEAAADHIVGIIERECDTSFITRVIVDEPHDGGSAGIVLDESYPQELLSVTEDGTALTDAALSVRGGILRRTSLGGWWSSGFDNVLVTYSHGYSTSPPPDIKRAALKATRLELMQSAADSSTNARRTSLSTEMGVESFVIAGQDRPTGWPEVDAIILSWKKRVYVPKAA